MEEGQQLQVKVVVVEGEVGYPNQAEELGLLLQAKVVEGIQDMEGEELEAALLSPHLANVEEEGEVTSWHLVKNGPGVSLLRQQKQRVLSQAEVVAVVIQPQTWE